MTNSERNEALARIHNELQQLIASVLPKRKPLERSYPMALNVVAIVEHPDGSRSLIGIKGGVSPELIEAFDSPEVKHGLAHPDLRDEYVEDRETGSRTNGFDIN